MRRWLSSRIKKIVGFFAGKDGRRKWSNLPYPALDSVAAQLSCPADFLAFSGVCKEWRTAAINSTVISRFISSSPPLLLLSPSSTFYATIFYSINDDAIYFLPISQNFAGLLLTSGSIDGQSNGHLIVIKYNADDRVIISVVNPLTSLWKSFPAMNYHSFIFAILSSPALTSPDCRFLIFREESFSSINVWGRSEWVLHEVPFVIDAIIFHGQLYITQLDETDIEHTKDVHVFEYDLEEKKIKREIVSCPKGFLMVSSEEELLMVYDEDGEQVGRKLMPRREEEMGVLGRNWPAAREQSLFLSWQRNDYCCSFEKLMEKMAERRGKKVHEIDISSSFWRIFLEKTKLLHSNGYYLFDDAHGSADLSICRPASFYTYDGRFARW